jgi:hypothetical protein
VSEVANPPFKSLSQNEHPFPARRCSYKHGESPKLAKGGRTSEARRFVEAINHSWSFAHAGIGSGEGKGRNEAFSSSFSGTPHSVMRLTFLLRLCQV